MTRLILLLLVMSVVVIAVQVVTDFIRPRPRPARSRSAPSLEVLMPDAMRTIAFVLLLVLALGVTTGFLGGA